MTSPRLLRMAERTRTEAEARGITAEDFRARQLKRARTLEAEADDLEEEFESPLEMEAQFELACRIADLRERAALLRKAIGRGVCGNE